MHVHIIYKSVRRVLRISLAVVLLCLLANEINAQDSIIAPQKTVVAGPQYETRPFHQWLWGSHYRKEWNTPVTVKVLMLDTVAGGLVAYEEGGGRQSKSLKLKNAQGKEFVIRSIDKSYTKALPEIYQNTFVEKIANDQVSIAHPFAAVSIPGMAAAAKINHTQPEIYFIPAQKNLGEFSNEYGNKLYILEQRPDGNWEEAANFGNAKAIISTEDLLEELKKNTNHRVDQFAYVRARLFDMFVGDWGRHEDQWRWGVFQQDDKIIYQPIPRDRDQAYTKFDGKLLPIVISAAGIRHYQTFDFKIKDIPMYNFPARNLDRQLANEPTREQWISIATELQQLLTDNVIEESVKKLPPEVFPISGNEIISKLKSRRDNLVNIANEYYSFLSKEVEITGSDAKEIFDVRREIDGTVVTIYNDGSSTPFYSRKFLKQETKEIRLYGISGQDIYNVSGTSNDAISVRLIGGPDRDSYNDSSAGSSKSIWVYDNDGNDFNQLNHTRLKLSNDSAVHRYDYESFQYGKKGIQKILFYNNDDRIHVGLGYKVRTQGWRKQPFASEHSVAVKFSLMERAFSTEYKGTITDIMGKWNLDLYGNYDWVRWINYFGIGNETTRFSIENDYYRMRTRQMLLSAGLSRYLSDKHKLGGFLFYHTYDIIDDKGRFLSDHMPGSYEYEKQQFAGAQFDYAYQSVDDPVLPRKGMKLNTSVAYTQNIKESNSSFTRYTGSANVYVPLSATLGIAIKAGGATLSGSPEFYQLNRLGGGQTLRGYRRFRYYGKSAAYAQNELQWIKNVKGNLFNGRAGLLALVDIGRVWYPGEQSNLWHTGFGGGFILAPFNKTSVAVTYARSKDDATINFRFARSF